MLHDYSAGQSTYVSKLDSLLFAILIMMNYKYFYFYSTIGILKYVQTIGLATMDAHMNKLVQMG